MVPAPLFGRVHVVHGPSSPPGTATEIAAMAPPVNAAHREVGPPRTDMFRRSSTRIHHTKGEIMLRSRIHWVAMALLAAAISAAPASAQLSDNLGALTGDNAKGYLSPLPKALSATLNSAIYQTGNVPKNTFNLSVGFRLMGVGFSDDSKSYRPTAPPGFTPTSDVDAPTVIGSTSAVAQSGQGGTTLYHPGGFDISEFAVATPD